MQHMNAPALHYLTELLKLMSIESVMPLNPLILCHSLSFLPSIFPTIRVFPNELAPQSDGQSTGASASASILPMSIQGWFPLGLTGLISLLSKELSRVFSSVTIRKHQFSSTQASLWYNTHMVGFLVFTGKTIALTIWNFASKLMFLLYNTLSRLL